ncbi:hypothetical protein BJQ97_03458 [Geobacillus sp. TFV-3]|nr:hypothetical protein BJQ97_03458 [Geobacillus sp. TFV-3]
MSVLPSFLLPYVQYTRPVIWQAVKTWLETPRRGAKTKQVGFPTKEVILFYVRRFFTESLPLASRGGEEMGDHRPCGERKNRTGGLVDADHGGTGGSIIQDMWTNERWHPFADQMAS